MLKVYVTYPSCSEEKEMYRNILTNESVVIKKILKKEKIFWIQELVSDVFVSDSIYEYVMNIVDATRNPYKYKISDLQKYIMY
jgi:MoxR-like ATPase